MFFEFKAACGTFVGNGKINNEDNFYFNKKHLPTSHNILKNILTFQGDTNEAVVFAVFDGMGGECHGELASCKASEVFSNEIKKLDEIVLSGKSLMCICCEEANAEINRLRVEKQLSSIGTTVAALYISQNEAVSCNVGDSKIFRIRNDVMTQISEDHTDEKIMSSVGIKKKPVLLQYLGVPNTEMSIDPYIIKGDICHGDIYVVCTDGVTDFVDPNNLYQIVTNNNSEDAARDILAAVKNNNGFDNATVIVITIL